MKNASNPYVESASSYGFRSFVTVRRLQDNGAFVFFARLHP